MTGQKTLWSMVQKVREANPLVHNITNFVVMNTTANALLAAGASPIMAHAQEEMAEMAGIAGALVINIGTLSAPWIESMFAAGAVARDKGTPVVVDPVGAGASRLRTETSVRLLKDVRPTVLRGNASEILAVAGASGLVDKARLEAGTPKGVDSRLDARAVADVADDLAEASRAVICVSGPSDLVTDGTRRAFITGGDEMMPLVTGLGCTATSLVGAYSAVMEDAFDATVAAMAVMSTAGGMAASRANGPGTMQLHFIDALYTMTEEDIKNHVTVEYIG